MAKTKKKNPQDLTLRNLRALKARIKLIEGRVAILFEMVNSIGATKL